MPLLKGVTGEVDAVADETRFHGVRPYNLATQERIVRGRMPGLEIINDPLRAPLARGHLQLHCGVRRKFPSVR